MKWDALLTSTLVFCAVVTTALVVRREFFLRPESASGMPSAPVFRDDWRSLMQSGVTMGPSAARVQLLELADFECPYCASFHKVLKHVRERFPTEVAVSFVHYPLPGHRFAEPASRAAECAREQGRFEAMHDGLFEQQSLFGIKPWREFASGADVKDLGAFDACMQSERKVPKVIEGQRVAKQLDARGTPTLMVNGWLLADLPDAAKLEDMVNAVLAGKNPVADEH